MRTGPQTPIRHLLRAMLFGFCALLATWGVGFAAALLVPSAATVIERVFHLLGYFMLTFVYGLTGGDTPALAIAGAIGIAASSTERWAGSVGQMGMAVVVPLAGYLLARYLRRQTRQPRAV